MQLMREHLSKLRILRWLEAWKKLKESFEGTQAVKGAKAYILKEKFASFKMKEDDVTPLVLRVYLAPRFRPKKNFRNEFLEIFLFKTHVK